MKLSQLLQEKCQDIQAIAARPHFKCQIKRLTLSIRRIVQPLKHLLLHFFLLLCIVRPLLLLI